MTAPRYQEVARLHAQGMGQGFLPALGEPFLALLYEALADTPGAVLLTREVDGHVIGFVCGAPGLGKVYRALLRRPLGLAGALWPNLLAPRKLWRVLEILRYSARAVGGSDVDLPSAELVSIVVAPEWRGRGIAEDLYAELVDQFALRGQQAFKIVVGEALAPAHRFYRRMGAVPAAEVQVHGGARSIVYVHRVDASGLESHSREEAGRGRQTSSPGA